MQQRCAQSSLSLTRLPARSPPPAPLWCADDVAKNRAFAEAEGFTFPLLCDTDLSVAVAYGAAADASAPKAARIAALIDSDGNIAKYYDPAGKAEFPPLVLGDLS